METKFRIVETEEYTLAVFNKIEEGINPKILHFDNKVDKNNIYKSLEMFTENPMYLHISGIDDDFRTIRKIIAYQPKGNAPELDLPLLPKVVVEDDVNLKLQHRNFSKKVKNPYLTEEKEYQVWERAYIDGFDEGHKAATKVYSEEDLRKAIEESISWWEAKPDEKYGQINTSHDFGDEFIQSLKQPKWFVAEIEEWLDQTYSEHGCYKQKLKTTTINNKIHLVGTYLN
jgi:hypothetical protein